MTMGLKCLWSALYKKSRKENSSKQSHVPADYTIQYQTLIATMKRYWVTIIKNCF